MNKIKERERLNDLLNFSPDYELVKSGESPDFIIKNKNTGELIGVELTEYYPHRNRKGALIPSLRGKFGNTEIRNRFRSKIGLSINEIRVSPEIDIKDFYSNCIEIKENKLDMYKQLHPECEEFWLLVLIDFHDNIMYERMKEFKCKFQRLYVWEEPHEISLLSMKE